VKAALWDRLRQRKLFQWALAYAAGAWVIFEASDAVGGRWELPNVLFQGLSVVLIAGFFVTLVLAWYHGEKGRQRVSGPELLMLTALFIIAGVALSAVGPSPDPTGGASTPSASTSDDDRPSIAVMPFSSTSTDAESRMFADGVHDDLLTQLSKVKSLRVISRTSVERFRETELGVPEIANVLGVDAVMEGSVQRVGGQIRVNAQLIDGVTDGHLWAETYDRVFTVEQLLDLQAEIARNVSIALRTTLSPEDEAEIRLAGTDNPEAYAAYLEGLALLARGSTPYIGDVSDAAYGAVEAFQEAVRLDPEFALAHARLSRAHRAVAFTGADQSDERFDLIRQSAQTALDLDPDLPEAMIAMGSYHYRLGRGGDFDLALQFMQAAHERQPNRFFSSVASVQRRRGEWEQAAEYQSRASDQNPLSFNSARESALNYLRMREYERSERYLDRSDAIRPTPITNARRALLFLMRDGDVDSAIKVLYAIGDGDQGLWPSIAAWAGANLPRRIAARVFCSREICAEATNGPRPQTWVGYRSRADLFGLLGDREREMAYNDSAAVLLERDLVEHPWDSLSILSALCLSYAGLDRADLVRQKGEELQRLEPHKKDALWGTDYLRNLAEAYVPIGDHDSAIDQLEIVLSVPSVMSANLLEVDPVWDPLRDHPRFQALLEKYGSEP
jgi:serine/threonine-protein kinase